MKFTDLQKLLAGCAKPITRKYGGVIRSVEGDAIKVLNKNRNVLQMWLERDSLHIYNFRGDCPRFDICNPKSFNDARNFIELSFRMVEVRYNKHNKRARDKRIKDRKDEIRAAYERNLIIDYLYQHPTLVQNL